MFASHKECLKINSEMIGSPFITACMEGETLSHWLHAFNHRVFSEQNSSAIYTVDLEEHLLVTCIAKTSLSYHLLCISQMDSAPVYLFLPQLVPSTSYARFRRAHDFCISVSFLNVEYIIFKIFISSIVLFFMLLCSNTFNSDVNF